jgi:hypothetical protein
MENKPKHTLGPWWESMDGEIQSDTYRICNPFLNSGMVPKIEEQEANAALIAAGPELLAQLKQLYAAHKFSLNTGSAYVVDEMVVTFIAAAIAKAEGKII